jgi:hypothetical protein
MSNKAIILVFVVAVVIGTLTFLLKRFYGFDFKPYGIGLILALIALIIAKGRKTKSS